MVVAETGREKPILAELVCSNSVRHGVCSCIAESSFGRINSRMAGFVRSDFVNAPVVGPGFRCYRAA